MPDPYQFQYPSQYSPGQIAFNNNAEMSQLLSLFGGPILQNMVGAGNFLPHMTPSQGLMDQYMARQYQNQTRMSTMYMAGAGNQDVAKRLLAMRTAFTNAPASELNKQQAEQFAGLLNNPLTKSLMGSMIGPENLEAMLHGQKGDVAALNNVANRIGFFRNDPSGGKRMDARSLEDFSRGMYAHLYEEGGNLSGVERDVRMLGGDTQTYNEDPRVATLKKYAKMENRTLVSDDEITSRVTKRIAANDLSADDVAAVYKKHVAGDETDTGKQITALTKFDEAIKSLDATVKTKSADKTGILQKDDVTVDSAVRAAKENRVGEMHGFMAGQVGQVAEQMFQRGMLPQAIGAMSPAERVKLLSKERENDPETLRRLAEEFGHRDLLATDTMYANMTPEKQRQTLNERLGNYQSKLENVFTEVDKFNAGKAGSKSAQEIEQMEGFDAVAGNVDAKRSAAAIKQYTGSLAAIREIFGDNGNPNAPMPALMAALDHLSQGAASQMDPKKIETALRSMQQMARESGVGFEQMAGMAAQMGAMGDMMGISKSQTMHNQVNAMAMVKTMRDGGAFSKPVFGAMSQAEATQAVAQSIQAGEASDNSKTMAALAGIYKASPEAFANSEFAKAMEAYNNPSSGGKYTIEDANGNVVEKNIFEIVGKGGPQALQALFRAAGGRDDQLSAAFMNPASQQFAQAGAGFQTQKYEMLRDINNMAISGTLNERLKTANAATPTTDLAKRDTAATADMTGQALTELILESSGMQQPEQIKHIQKNMVPTLQAAFMKNGVTDPTEALRLAEQAATAYMGSDPSKQGGEVKQLIDQAGAMVYEVSGMTMAQAWQMQGGGRAALSGKEALKAAAVAQRKAETGLNFSSQPLARISDYLLRVGEKGGKVNKDEMLAALTNMIPEEELRNKYMGGMLGGVDAVQSAINDMQVSAPQIQDMIKNKDNDTLKKLAGVDASVNVVSDEDFDARRRAKMEEALKDDKQVSDEFKRQYGVDKTELSVAAQREQLMSDANYKKMYDTGLLADKEITQSQLNEGAMLRGVNQMQIIPGETDAARAVRARKLENLKTIRSSMFESADASKRAAGVTAALSYFDIDGSTKKDGKGPTLAEELVQLVGAYSTDPEEDAKHKKALADKIQGLSLGDADKKMLTDVSEAARVGSAIDPSGVLGQLEQAAGMSQAIAQQIENASIEATTVTINADSVKGAGTDAAADAPAADSIKPTANGETPAGAAGASTTASAAATDTAASTQKVEPVTVPTPAAGEEQKEVKLSGTLTLENLESGVLTVLAKRDNQALAMTPGGGSPVA